MDFTPLTEEQRQTFEENGYLIVRNALEKEMIDRLIETGDRLMKSFQYEGYYQHRRDGLVQEKVFAELATQSTTVPLIVQLLGHHIHITNTALVYKHPQDPEKSDTRVWHRDVGVALDIGHEDLPRVGLKVGYCLTDFTMPNSGATWFVRKSNNMPGPLPIPKGQVNPDDYDEVSLKAGDAFLFESRTYHAPGDNYSDHIAKVVIYGYHYRWIKPDHYMHYYNDRIQPDDQLLNQLDDVGRQLLCARVDTRGQTDQNGIHWAIQAWAEQHGIADAVTQAPHIIEV